MTKLLIAFLISMIAIPVSAQPLDLDAIAKQPGTEVTKKMHDGSEIVEIRRGSVIITIEREGETSEDTSGKAVLCLWNLMISVKIATDLCYPGEFPQLNRMLAEQIDASNTFIAANSLRPVTKAQLEQYIERRTRSAETKIKTAGLPPAQNLGCKYQREENILPLNAEIDKMRREIQEALLVPRPPAMNPCF